LKLWEEFASLALGKIDAKACITRRSLDNADKTFLRDLSLIHTGDKMSPGPGRTTNCRQCGRAITRSTSVNIASQSATDELLANSSHVIGHVITRTSIDDWPDCFLLDSLGVCVAVCICVCFYV